MYRVLWKSYSLSMKPVLRNHRRISNSMLRYERCVAMTTVLRVDEDGHSQKKKKKH